MNPIFYEVIDIVMDMRNFSASPPIVLDFYDNDDGLLDHKDDFLGRAVIELG